MTGDFILSGQQRVSRVPFLGHEVEIPETPHIFALLSGAPIFVFFAHRQGSMQYHIELHPPFQVKAAHRGEREGEIRRSVFHYANLLEKQVRKHPLEWYHFKAFLGRKLG
jgi:predicted LPLAT superfamily acyltransferase